MQKNVSRILSGLLAVVILSFVIVPAFAADDFGGGSFGGGASRSDFFTWANGFDGGSFGGGAGRGDKDAYNDYVQTLPATGYDSSGGLLWSPKLTWFGSGYGTRDVFCPHYNGTRSNSLNVWNVSFDCANNSMTVRAKSDGDPFYGHYLYYRCDDVYPVDGTYSRIVSPSLSGTYLDDSGKTHSVAWYYSANRTLGGSKGAAFEELRDSTSGKQTDTIYKAVSAQLQFYAPVYRVTPSSLSDSSNTYNTNTRPSSITGGILGTADVDANGQLTGSYTKLEGGNTSIVNETNNTYYNPVTNTTSSISNWSYDYSDRSYKVDYTTTNTTGDTVTNTSTVTYGDEYITIQEIDNSQGDTVTNVYTIYYLIQGTGSGGHTHDWRESGLVPASCLAPGVKTYTCAECQDTKRESTPALGHNWRILRTVTNQYDDDGLLIQEGYILYECERCGEQYRTTDTSVKPSPGNSGNTGSGTGTGSGGEEEGGGFLNWLFGKIGELLGTIGDGILNLLKTALEKIFGGLIDLVTSLFENLSKLVDLFGAVGEAFQVLWTWLPPEVTAILVAGVSIFVFIAPLKFFMK